MTWQLQEAKNRLSEVVNLALREGPQTITRHGKPTVMVISVDEYNAGRKHEKLSTILRECPVKGWTVKRDKDLGRTISFE